MRATFWKLLAVLSFLPLLPACGAPDEGPAGTHQASTGAATTGGSTGTGTVDPDAGGLSVTFDPIKVAPGKERTQCVVKNLGNAEAIHVGRIHNVLGEGSHHLIVYRTSDTVEQTTPFDCQPFTDALHPEKGSPLMISQKPDDALELPPGVGYTLQPNQMIRLEMHYINPTAAEIEVSATSTMVPSAEGDVHDEADFLFIGNPDISIPAHTEKTLGPSFLRLPADFAGVSFYGLTGHTHQWGTNVTVATAPAKTGPDTPVYDVPGWKWNEPATVYPEPPFQLPEGGGFHFSCSWNNLSDHAVSFGESANAEMCFFWAYYYPSRGAFVCFHSEQVPGGIDLCCPGSALCDQLFP